MRRILRKIVAGEGDQLGDLSTLADPQVVEERELTDLLSLLLSEVDFTLATPPVKKIASPK